jgi:hypothetical protein
MTTTMMQLSSRKSMRDRFNYVQHKTALLAVFIPLGVSILFSCCTSQISAQGDVSQKEITETGIAIVNNVNKSKHDKYIKFSEIKKRGFDDFGHDEFFKYYHEKLGTITLAYPPAIMSGLARFQIVAEKGRWSMIVGFETDGSVCSLRFVDPDPIIPVPERNTKPMRLPFRGEWHVESGGPTPEQNDHIVSGDKASRRAVDFTIRDAEGQSFTGDGTKNEEYYSYGKEILAVADGVVVTVIDGVPDNRPRIFNPMTDAGNTVILKHSDHEFSLYCHLKTNSTSVKVGQKVASGQVIGQCGNSGFSPSPHLHFDLCNTDVAYDATGFTPYFQNVTLRRKDTKTLSQDYTPLKDDFVQSLK